MAKWRQVKSYIYQNYQVSGDSGDILTLLLDTGNGRSQIVHVGHVDADDQSSIMLSVFAQKSMVSADRVLTATEIIPAGIRSTGDLYAVSHMQLLETIDEPEIDWQMVLVASYADQLEEYLGLVDQF